MKILKNESGLSLVELLVSFALLSLVVLLITSIQLFGQNQMTSQTEQAELQSDVRLALNIITKEIRSAESVEEYENDVLTIDETVEIKLEGTTITQNGATMISEIAEFKVDKDGSRVEIYIESVSPKQGEPVSHSTVIYLRE